MKTFACSDISTMDLQTFDQDKTILCLAMLHPMIH